MAHIDPTKPVEDRHPVFPWLTESRRGLLYRVLTAGGALAVFYGLMTANEVALWVGLAVAVSNGTPAAHTPVRGT